MSKYVAMLTAALSASLPFAAAAQAPAFPNTNNPYLKNVPAPAPSPMMLMPKGTGPLKDPIPWAMSQMPSAEQKKQMMKTMLPYLANMGLNIRDIMNYMTTKYPAKPGVSFDDVVVSMQLRANQLNLKQVGHSPMWKDIESVLGDTTSPRMEVFHFCDIAAGREIMKLVPEAIVYLPCRIAVMEDNKKNIWVLTLDWDTAWLDSINGSMGVTPELAKMAMDIRNKMDNVMRAGANGDL
ncbi:MAG TPA: DUF302 domain-containing protein [Thiobacillus sp.]